MVCVLNLLVGFEPDTAAQSREILILALPIKKTFG